MLYASTMEYLKKAVNMSVFIHADDQEDIEWEELVKAASGGKAKWGHHWGLQGMVIGFYQVI